MKFLFAIALFFPMMSMAQTQDEMNTEATAQVFNNEALEVLQMSTWCGRGSDGLCYGRFPGATCTYGNGQFGTCMGFPNPGGDNTAACVCR